MRKVIDSQLKFGNIDISQIKFDPKSRDDIPQILRGLQYLYTQKSIRDKIFNILEQKIAPNKNKKNGRPGMDLWKILVIGSLRLNLNMDYDRLHELVNNHKTIREMLGHGFFDSVEQYERQTLKDNIGLLTPEILNEINLVVVSAGHELLKKKEDEDLKGRCDSFVVKTNVHFPTDINLLFDATRKVIKITARLCNKHGLTGWRQHNFNVKSLKRQSCKLQKMKRSSSNNLFRKNEKEKAIKSSYNEYIKSAKYYIEKAEKIKLELLELEKNNSEIEKLEYFINHALTQINLIERRVFQNEEIPHEEKVFSVFEPHTEWISKGKMGVPVELGLRVAIVEDHLGFVLHHKIMEKQTDEKIAIPLLKETAKYYPTLKSCSFDKGFHSPLNQIKLKEILETVALPKKGKSSKLELENQQSHQYRAAKKKHSAVESAINALEVHGLDRCPDKGIDSFKKYVGLAIMARNIQIIGAFLIKKEINIIRRQKKHQKSLRAYLSEIAA